MPTMRIFTTLRYKVREYLETEVNLLYKEEKTQGFNSNDYLKLFRHIQGNQMLYRTYFKLGYDNQYQIHIMIQSKQ